MYVAVKGGERAIENAHAWLAEARRGDPAVPELTVEQIAGQLALAVDRVMAEGSLYDRRLAALAVRQARGDLIEAIFLVRAYRTTLPRFGYAAPIDTEAMTIKRRISAAFKDLPGGQILGPTFDYTHRLIDFAVAGADEPMPAERGAPARSDGALRNPPRVVSILDREGLLEQESPEEAPDGAEPEPGDITRHPLDFPADRGQRLQALARGDEGYLLALGYSTQRGYGRTHPFAGEIRHGAVEVEYTPPELGFPVVIGEIEVTECQLINQFSGSTAKPPQFTQGYGLAFGQGERKAMAMALVDRALRAAELGEEVGAPAQNEEFVLAHADNVQATGFVEHLKLPHYVDFQSELELVRKLRAEWQAPAAEAAE
jgi:alpha-D-ribose 1-methylphosphonate 5-triphosphate synthase subunit PhnI